MKPGTYVKLPNGDRGFVLETRERDGMGIVLGDWDTPLPVAVRLADLESAEGEAWTEEDGERLRRTAIGGLIRQDVPPAAKQLARLSLRLLASQSTVDLSEWIGAEPVSALTTARINLRTVAEALGLMNLSTWDITALSQGLAAGVNEALKQAAEPGWAAAQKNKDRLARTRHALLDVASTLGVVVPEETESLARDLAEKVRDMAALVERAGNTEARVEMAERDLQGEGKALDEALRRVAELDEERSKFETLYLAATAERGKERARAEAAEGERDALRIEITKLSDVIHRRNAESDEMARRLAAANAQVDRLQAAMDEREERLAKLAYPTVQPSKTPTTCTFTKEQMLDEFDLPGGEYTVLDKVEDTSRWSVHYRLVFRLPDMPEGFAWETGYSVGATESQDETPWQDEDNVECTLVRQVPKTVIKWVPAEMPTSEPVPPSDPDDGPSGSEVDLPEEPIVTITGGSHIGKRGRVVGPSKFASYARIAFENGHEDDVRREFIEPKSALPPVGASPEKKTRSPREAVSVAPEDVERVYCALKGGPLLKGEIVQATSLPEAQVSVALDVLATQGRVVRPTKPGKAAKWAIKVDGVKEEEHVS